MIESYLDLNRKLTLIVCYILWGMLLGPTI